MRARAGSQELEENSRTTRAVSEARRRICPCPLVSRATPFGTSIVRKNVYGARYRARVRSSGLDCECRWACCIREPICVLEATTGPNVNPIVEFAAGDQLWGMLIYSAVGSLMGWNLLSIRFLLSVSIPLPGFVKSCLVFGVAIAFVSTLLVWWLISLKDLSVTWLEYLAFLVVLASVLAFWKQVSSTMPLPQAVP